MAEGGSNFLLVGVVCQLKQFGPGGFSGMVQFQQNIFQLFYFFRVTGFKI